MIAVVGGGITGLATGWELQRLGQDVVVLEATERAGGVIRSAEVDGRVLDWGPQRMRLAGRMAAIVAALGLQDQLLTAPSDLPLHVFRGGHLRAVPFSVGAFLKSDLVSAASKMRAALEPFTARADPEESVAEYFTRKVGRELYETLAGPLYGGLYASDPADMRVGLALIHALRELGVRRSLILRFLRGGGRLRPPPACTFREGMEALPAALARCLGGRLRLEAPVRELSRSGAGWLLRTEVGRVDASAVVMTAPASATGALLRRVAPDVGDRVGSLRYNPLAVVHLDAETTLRGMGFQVALTERDLMLRGVTFNDSLFGRRNLYTAYLGGARHAEVSRMDEVDLAKRATQEFRLCTGCDARALAVRHTSVPAWDLTWSSLGGARLPEGLHFAASWWSRPGLSGRLAEAERTARLFAGIGASLHAELEPLRER